MVQIFLYGGYSKEVSSEKSSEKGVVHADLWSLDPRTWEWNKVCTFTISSFMILQLDWTPFFLCIVIKLVAVIRWRKLGCLLALVQGFRYVSTKSVLCCLVVLWTWKWKVRKWLYPCFLFFFLYIKLNYHRPVWFIGAGDVMMSLFLNELYGFQLDNRRWYPIELRKEKSSKDKVMILSTRVSVACCIYVLSSFFFYRQRRI